MGRPVGYNVVAVCDQPDCTTTIDRGVSYLCGGGARVGTPENPGCGLHFCTDHLMFATDPRPGSMQLWSPQLCPACVEMWEHNERIAWAETLSEDLPICGWPDVGDAMATLQALDEHLRKHPELALRWIDAAAIARDAVGLFLEHRDEHGESEDDARIKAVIETAESAARPTPLETPSGD